MKKYLIILIGLVAVLSLKPATGCAQKYEPLPVPKNVRVTSSAPRAVVWATLSEKEKNLALHLFAAARVGRTISYYQNHRHGLALKDIIESALSSASQAKTKLLLGEEGYIEFQNYAAKFEDLMGPYESSNRKYVLKVVTPTQVQQLVQRYSSKLDNTTTQEIVRLMTDPTFEVTQGPEDEHGTNLENSGGNFYEHGITGAEVKAAVAAGLNSNLNCRIVRDGKGGLKCQVQALNNPELDAPIRSALTKIVDELTLALPLASSDHQALQLKHLIKYFKEGDVEDFRQMNIEWVKDGTKSKVDFMMGYVEVYQDYLNQIGSWESYVQIVDPKTTELSVGLAKNAQYFEDQMPYGIYKKTFPLDYSPPALMVYYFQEISSFHSGGYNLPNFDDIRRDVGAKNIIKLDLPGEENDPETLRVRREKYEAFMPKEKVDRVMTHWPKARRTVVLLHEIIGHGSGTYDTTMYGPKEDPIGALGSLGSALEEQRADLAALSFANDPRLVTVGLFKDQNEADEVRKAMYDAYVADFLWRLSKSRTVSEAHARGNWLSINFLLEKGAVEKVSKDGSPMTDDNMVFVVKDYEKFHQVSMDTLAELQRIKAVRDEAGLKNIFAKYSPLDEATKPWALAIIKRGLNLAVNSGSIEQPWESDANGIRALGDLTITGIAPHWPGH